jgi:hypothetical protein
MDMILSQYERVCSAGYSGILNIWNKDTGVCELSIQVCDSLHKVVQ